MVLSASLRFIHLILMRLRCTHDIQPSSAVAFNKKRNVALWVRMRSGKGIEEMSMKIWSLLFGVFMSNWNTVYLLVNLFRITNRLVNILFCSSCSADVRHWNLSPLICRVFVLPAFCLSCSRSPSSSSGYHLAEGNLSSIEMLQYKRKNSSFLRIFLILSNSVFLKSQ